MKKRILYSLPVAGLLLPWAFIALTVFVVGMFFNPYSLLLMIPVLTTVGGAFAVHRAKTKAGQHGLAAFFSSAILFAPLMLILVGFWTPAGQSLASDQAVSMGYTSHLLAKKGPCEH